ncbi:MAG: DUF3303 family protein [Candidatus Rokubacteria bacterium]|nr:DUF3303 family protein [Candidatus Rokubacteria bacterium]
MLYMLIERYRNGDAVAVYRRFRERGRMTPDGVRYVSSWITEDMATCYQVMDADDRRSLDGWISRWSDLIDFEVISVMTSPQAVERIAPRLERG